MMPDSVDTAPEESEVPIEVVYDAVEAVESAAAVEPAPAPVVDRTDIVPDTQVSENTKPVSRVAQILAITTEQKLLIEMAKFEESVYERIHPLRVLLAQDLHSIDVPSIQNHMTDVERWRETVLRWASLAKTFVTHCKGSHFILQRTPGSKMTIFEQEAYQKKLLAGFIGLEYWLDGMVANVDSRVNMAKVLLRLDEAGQYHPGSQQKVA
jgi:hypothetical protein